MLSARLARMLDVRWCERARVLHRAVRVLFTLSLLLSTTTSILADDTFVYSSNASIRGINISLGTDNLLTTAPGLSAVNGLAINTNAGLIYYGDATRVYRWNPALGSGTRLQYSKAGRSCCTVPRPTSPETDRGPRPVVGASCRQPQASRSCRPPRAAR